MAAESSFNKNMAGMLDSDLHLTLIDFVDISASLSHQIDLLRHRVQKDDLARREIVLQDEEAVASNRRMLKIWFTDKKYVFVGIEYTSIPQLESIPQIGTRVVVKAGTETHRNLLLLTGDKTVVVDHDCTEEMLRHHLNRLETRLNNLTASLGTTDDSLSD